MTGVEFAGLVLSLPREEQALDVTVLVDVYQADAPSCRDCGGRHLSVWEAIACDGLSDARRRLECRRRARRMAVQLLVRSETGTDDEGGAS